MTTKTTEIKKSIFETDLSSMNIRTKNTIAAAAGAAVGLGLTALSDRANALTLGTTAAFGVLAVGSVYSNDLLHGLTPDTTETKVIVGGMIGLETAVFGCVMNLLAGTSSEAE